MSSKKLLILICILFLFTRFYKVAEIPPSLYWDEASIGYNAYSILKTGTDEWGKHFPIHFRAFGEFKLPVFIYSVSLIEVLFGLSEFAIRFTAILYSFATLIVIYFLGTKISQRKEIGLLSAFLYCISSWSFIFSRTGYEVNAGIFFYLLGILLMLNFYKSIIYPYLSTICFILSLYSYNGFRIVAPLTFIVLFLFIGNEQILKRKLSYILISLLLFIISIIPIAKVSIYDAGFGRIQSFTIFPTIKQVYDLQGHPRLQIIYDRSNNTKLKFGESLLTFTQNYLSHFSPDFLILRGDKNQRSQQKGFGQIYSIDIIFFFLGILYLLKVKKRLMYLPIILLFINPIPASLFKESPHALRALPMVPFICIISAIGIWRIGQKNKSIYVWAPLVYLLFFGNYFWHFLTSYPKTSSLDWQYPYKQIYNQYHFEFNKFDEIVISNQYAQPYIFALFYLKIPSSEFKQKVKYANVEDWGFSTVTEIGKFRFKKIDQKESFKPNSLIFITPSEKINSLKEVGIIKNLDNSAGLYIYENK